MPIYEYKCDHCSNIIEVAQSINDHDLTDCYKCGSKGTLKRLISKSSFILKGKGWYATDYGNKKNKPSKEK